MVLNFVDKSSLWLNVWRVCTVLVSLGMAASIGVNIENIEKKGRARAQGCCLWLEKCSLACIMSLSLNPASQSLDPARPQLRQPQPPSPDARPGVSLELPLSWYVLEVAMLQWPRVRFSIFLFLMGSIPWRLMKIKICIANNPIPEQTSQTRNKQLEKSIMFQTSDLIPCSLTPCLTIISITDHIDSNQIITIELLSLLHICASQSVLDSTKELRVQFSLLK